MRVLISNDDGLDAKGIQTLAETLSGDYNTTVVAPDRNRSGASNSLTLTRPLQPIEVREGQYRIDGTPTDCVNLALSGAINDQEFDAVVSGVNHGPNLGDDVIYSGTVAAALEARHLGRPAIAVSLVGNTHFDTAAKVVLFLIKNLIKDSHTLALPPKIILNVNVPDMAYEALSGFKITRLGHRHSSQPAVTAHHPRGVESYWIGALSEPYDAAPGTDFDAIKNGYVSITPIHADMTCHSVLSTLEDWAGSISI
ncbi:5'/3'-nucleotidase SurE [Marinomonas balearica]|uniref:5'-nucleotidase SurE n=1 Tax=Marinomonas balearica TaxID=491947 RepID=A0A4R6M596_9GAMM|nr:5'/3'-nucleotidase SurE [Marinomonas balearica]TDO96414.1 5'-nucleotidase /3'-nucleotidase /exopolyphosphatase [Marinomonas balearica]